MKMKLFSCLGKKQKKLAQHNRLLSMLDDLIEHRESITQIELDRYGKAKLSIQGATYEIKLTDEIIERINAIKINRFFLKFNIGYALLINDKMGISTGLNLDSEKKYLTELPTQWTVQQYEISLSDFHYCYNYRLDLTKLTSLNIDCSYLYANSNEFPSLIQWLKSDDCQVTNLTLTNTNLSGKQFDQLKHAIQKNRSLKFFECNSEKDTNTFNQIIRKRNESKIESDYHKTLEATANMSPNI